MSGRSDLDSLLYQSMNLFISLSIVLLGGAVKCIFSFP